MNLELGIGSDLSRVLVYHLLYSEHHHVSNTPPKYICISESNILLLNHGACGKLYSKVFFHISGRGATSLPILDPKTGFCVCLIDTNLLILQTISLFGQTMNSLRS